MRARWRQIKRNRDLPPSEESVLVTIDNDGLLEVIQAYWTHDGWADTTEVNWSFYEYYDHEKTKALAWCALPEPFTKAKEAVEK